MNNFAYDISLKGNRLNNEDRHVIYIKNGVELLGLFDGHGGNVISTYLSEVVSGLFLNNKRYTLSFPVEPKIVNSIYKYIDDSIKNKFGKVAYESGSTCLLSFIFTKNRKKYIQILNTGDSRIILCKKQNRRRYPIQLSNDHKPDNINEYIRLNNMSKKITNDGCVWRVGSLSVSRSFGDYDSKPYIISTPEMSIIEIDSNDEFILIACDGLWDVMSNVEVINFIDGRLKNNVDPKVIIKELANEAINLSSEDNISIIIKFLQ